MSGATPTRQLPTVLSAVMMLLGAGIATAVTVIGAGLSQVAAAALGGSLLLALGGYALYTRHVVGIVLGTTAVIGAALAFLGGGLPVLQRRPLFTIAAGGALVSAWYAVGLLVSGNASFSALRRVRHALGRTVAVLWGVAFILALRHIGGLGAGIQTAVEGSAAAFQAVVTTPLAAPPIVVCLALGAVLVGRSSLRYLVALDLLPGDRVPTGAIWRSVGVLMVLLLGTATASTLVPVADEGPSALRVGLQVYEQALVPVFSATPVLGGALGLVVALSVARLGLSVLGWIRAVRLTTVGRSTTRLLPAVGLTATVLVAVPGSLVIERLQLPPQLAGAVPTLGVDAFLLGSVGAALLPLLGVLLLIRVLRGIRLIPDTRAFAGIASAGFVTVVLVTAPSLSQPAVVAVGLGAALLIWDSAEFGVQLARDLDTRLVATPNEFVHHGMSLVVVAVAAALVVVVTNLTRPVASLLQLPTAAEATLTQSPLVLVSLLTGVVLLLVGFNAARPT